MRWVVGLLCVVIGGLVATVPVGAEAVVSKLLITEIHLGGNTITHNGVDFKQYVTLYNQSDADVSVEGWQLQYAKSDFAGSCTDASWSTQSQLTGTIARGTSVTFSYQLNDEAAGSIRIIDQNLSVHDTVGWGAARCFESTPATDVPANNKSIIRYANCDGTFAGADSNDNARDFASNQQPFTVMTAPDCTPTCDDDQQLIDDVCVDDKCTNLADFQATVPAGYHQDSTSCVVVLPVVITELLPNVDGSDEGNEFIELYNPNDSDIDLGLYELVIGDDTQLYSLPSGTMLAAHAYIVVKDSDLGFTLVNTTAKVTLQTVDGDEVDVTSVYTTPAEGDAWALIGNEWVYTNQPTPGAENKSSVVVETESVESSDPKPCAANQYRSTDTGRCRLVTTTSTDLAPCKDNQYRSEETNRCRNLATAASTLTPCKEGQYRSEETNRCRSIAQDTGTLAPCKEDQERNPDTNRCRTVAAILGDADFAVEPVPDTQKAFTGWWMLGGVGALAAGRVGWEWRSEMLAGIRKIGTFFTSGK